MAQIEWTGDAAAFKAAVSDMVKALATEAQGWRQQEAEALFVAVLPALRNPEFPTELAVAFVRRYGNVSATRQRLESAGVIQPAGGQKRPRQTDLL